MLKSLGIIENDLYNLYIPRGYGFLNENKRDILPKSQRLLIPKGESKLFKHIAKQNSILNFLAEF